MKACLFCSIAALGIGLIVPTPVWSQTQQDMDAAAVKHYETAQSTLNRVYAQLRKSLDPIARRKLATAEQRWSAYAAAESDFEADFYRGGSIEPMVAEDVRTQITIERISQLRAIIKQMQSR